MNIDIKDTILLDDNDEYVVVSKIHYKNDNYYYLVDINNTSNVKFVYQTFEGLVELDNKELITTLLPIFLKNIKTSINQ